MKIVFDVDGCLADFVLGFTELAHKHFGTPVTKTLDQPSWQGFPGMTKEQVSRTWDIINESKTFWHDLDPMVYGAEFEQIERLREYNEVYFCTARTGKSAKLQTELWLRWNKVKYPTVIICKHKGDFCKAVGADYAIEDKASNASYIDWQTNSKTKSYLINRPYNAVPAEFLASGVKRVNTVSEFMEAIQA
jgi:hypothetical protein